MESFTWSIDGAQKRKSITLFWLMTSVLIITFPMYTTSTSNVDFSSMLNSIIIGLSIESLYFGLKYLFVGSIKTYTISEESVTIVSKSGSHQYLWSEFSCFIRTSERLDQSMNQSYKKGGIPERALAYEAMALKTLEEVYLKFINIPFGVSKKFLILEVSGNDSANVLALLSKHIPRKKMKITTDLGLVMYKRS